MPQCQNCDAHLTPEYVRVFGVDSEVVACIHCTTNREARDAGARADVETRVAGSR